MTDTTTPNETGSAASVPLAEGLFTWPSDAPALLGSRCDDCGTMTFPTHYGCPRCSSSNMTTLELGTTGTVWTWTSQEFRPPEPYVPEHFEPYHLGYVELPGELIVETYLTGFDERTPQIGETVEFTVIPFTRNDDGVDVVTYAFRPAGATS